MDTLLTIEYINLRGNNVQVVRDELRDTDPPRGIFFSVNLGKQTAGWGDFPGLKA